MTDTIITVVSFWGWLSLMFLAGYNVGKRVERANRARKSKELDDKVKEAYGICGDRHQTGADDYITQNTWERG